MAFEVGQVVALKADVAEYKFSVAAERFAEESRAFIILSLGELHEVAYWTRSRDAVAIHTPYPVHGFELVPYPKPEPRLNDKAGDE